MAKTATGSATLMLIGAHHDDNELLAGTIARHVRAGWRVVSVVATAGRWIRGVADDRHIPVRNAESQRAAELLGMEVVFLDFSEGDFRADTETCRALACHHSQLPESGRGDGDMIELERTRARYRGIQAGCRYAVFLDPCERFPKIEEDEPRRDYLGHEYPVPAET